MFHFAGPKSSRLEPPLSSQPILVDSYELRVSLINKAYECTFSRNEKENPYSHLLDFKQVCSCLNFLGMSHETLKWKLFLFTLIGAAKLWNAQTVDSVDGEWEALRVNLSVFPHS